LSEGTRVSSKPSEPLPTPATVTVIVPTYNERDNVDALVDQVRSALAGERWELLFVDDDSPDGTAAVIDRHAAADARVRRLRRLGRRGLASACMEGALASTAEYLVVMDGDAQHDPRLLPQLLAVARAGRRDIVVAAREDAGAEPFRSAWRRRLTRIGNAIGRRLAHGATQDPLSGYFLVRRDAFERRVRRMYGSGFKILLDLLSAGAEPWSVAEIPTRLRARAAGDSKLRAGVALDYALLVVFRLGGGTLSPRFALYCAVGLSGVAVNLGVLEAAYAVLHAFVPSQALATFVAMTTNYALNNLITFRDRRLRGRAWWFGLANFYLACALGAFIGVAVGELLHASGRPVWVSGLAAAIVSAIWNFSVNQLVTWRAR
jgi:dolichol-phosphate mannosyltransferase